MRRRFGNAIVIAMVLGIIAGYLCHTLLDPADAYRPRRWVPIWQQACERDLRNGCQTLSLIETSYCFLPGQ